MGIGRKHIGQQEEDANSQSDNAQEHYQDDQNQYHKEELQLVTFHQLYASLHGIDDGDFFIIEENIEIL